MKIRVNKNELLAIVSKQLGMTVTAIVVAKEHAFYSNFMQKMGKEMGIDDLVDAHVTQSEKKILAIKALRSVVRDMGLFEAKCAVENWDRYVEAMRLHCRYPEIVPSMNSAEVKFN